MLPTAKEDRSFQPRPRALRALDGRRRSGIIAPPFPALIFSINRPYNRPIFVSHFSAQSFGKLNQEGLMERSELEEMTAPKLRELALEKYPEIKGVSGMKKEGLVEAIIAEEVRLGLRPKEERKRHPVQAAEWKQRIKALKAERAKALDAKDRELLRKSRVKIKRIKRVLRKLKEAS